MALGGRGRAAGGSPFEGEAFVKALPLVSCLKSIRDKHQSTSVLGSNRMANGILTPL